MSGATIALIVLVAFLALAGAPCALFLFLRPKGDSHKGTAATTTADPVVKPVKTAAPPPANDNWITAEHPRIKFLAPAGWSTEITPDKDWGIFKPPTRDAVFAFTTFNRPGESTVRLGKAANVLGVTDIEWNAPRYGTVGKEGFPDHYASGSCNFKGPGGFIWYATVNPGNDEHQILLIFTVTGAASPARRREAQAAIDSLQRR
jgi:hypothetical protein